MESQEQFLGLSDRFHVIKRRRVRHLKPLPSLRPRGGTSMAVSSSSSATADSLISAMAGEDDEDLANCLILLAQGDSPPTPNDHEHPREESSCEKSENMVDSVVRSQKASGSGVVYECKTCSRVFPSFQALGGHRASHSKPNKSIGISEVQNKERDRDQDQGQICRETIITASSAEPIPEKPGISLVARPGKVHECSICRSKFVSGQALGGHMRRHRSSVNSDHAAAVSVRTDDSSRKPRKILPLDLNLPAPKDDDEGDSIFVYGPGPPVPPLLFSAGALVDCHY